MSSADWLPELSLSKARHISPPLFIKSSTSMCHSKCLYLLSRESGFGEGKRVGRRRCLRFD